MSLIGSLVKSTIEIGQKLNFSSASAEEKQLDELKKLLRKASDTSFGKYYGFEKILESESIIAEFKRQVPIRDYHQMEDDWWAQQLKFADITWPGKPEYFALSSGTTGKRSKKIPITADFIQSMRSVGTSMIKELPNYDFPESLFESEILMLSSSADLHRGAHGALEGEISGINVSNFPDWYETFYRPGKEIAQIDNWDERIARIVAEAPSWDIGAIAGIPSWILIMLKEIVKKHQLKNLHEIWPNLAVFVSGGVAFETYRKDFDVLMGRPVQYMDTYLASEGFFSYSADPKSMNMRLAVEHGYFYEFIPFDNRGVDDQGELLENPESHTLNEVDLDTEYALVISTCAGAWRYIVGDVIKFTSIDPFEIKITGRTKFFLNVVGSQLSEEKMDTGILEVSKRMNCSINEYAVSAIKDEQDNYIHQWIIVSEDEVDTNEFKKLLDESLKEANNNYQVARSKALTDLRVQRISKKLYHDYLDQKKRKGGQIKTPKVMKEDKMLEFLNFIDQAG
ncbi:MAG: GH3 auxin-responsive promoter family protein [Cyclobacteriaceae bacterium]